MGQEASHLTARNLETEEQRQKRLEPLYARRQKERDEWDAFWKLKELETRGRWLGRYQYIMWRYFFDAPVAFWREKVIEPLQDKYGHWPYYHRRYRRVPTIDECHVNDLVCYHEAQMQYKLDKQVDSHILGILRRRKMDCMTYHHQNMLKCLQQHEDYEEAELNWYIKYGDMGSEQDVLACYMKQKHRMIWERRHPEVLEARQKAYEEHKKQLQQGYYDHWFWKRNQVWMYKDYIASDLHRGGKAVMPYTMKATKDPETTSMNPEYHRQRKENEEKTEGKTKVASAFDIFP